MLTQNSELRQSAWEAMTGNWKPAVIASLVIGVIFYIGAGVFTGCGVSSSFGISSFIYWVFIFALVMPIHYAFTIIMQNFLNGARENVLEDTDNYFKSNYSRAVITSVLVAVYTALWSMLFIIPGIIKSYSYAMTFYIANEMPEKSSEECVQLSMKMMYGNKAKLFWLDMSFIGWFLLCAITFGIAALFVEPYWLTARAAFYEDLKKETISIPQ